MNEDSCIAANQAVPLLRTKNLSLNYSQWHVIAVLPRSTWKRLGRMVPVLGAAGTEAWP